MKVSVILPTYNEAGNIVPLVSAILENIPPDIAPEVLVVDDNSPDGTYALAAETFAGDSRVRCLLRQSDRGFAKSIRHGIENATGDTIIVMDADFTHDPAEIPRLLHVGKMYDIVTGSRFCAGGSMQDKPHYLSSLLFNWLVRVIVHTQIQDNLGGYFCISRDTLLKFDFDSIFYGYGEYFIRFLYLAQRNGLSIVEIPAIYKARTRGESKSNFFKMLYTYSIAAVKIKFTQKKWL